MFSITLNYATSDDLKAQVLGLAAVLAPSVVAAPSATPTADVHATTDLPPNAPPGSKWVPSGVPGGMRKLVDANGNQVPGHWDFTGPTGVYVVGS